jgi:AcrR family transcriptional regulator
MVPQTFATSSKKAAPWGELDADEKRQRLLDVAKEVFPEQGLEATMPRVAAAAGVGVGSLYRSYGSKEDLVAALVIRQLRLLQAEVSVAAEEEDAWTAIEHSVRRIAERQATNKLLSAALGLISERRDVAMALGELSLAWQQLLDRAREEGTLRSDATFKDLRFIFAAARAADEVEPGGRDRILTLLLEALRR